MTKIEEARKSCGFSRKEMCERFKLPYRTLQSWELEDRQCPEWAEILILEKLENLKNEGWKNRKDIFDDNEISIIGWDDNWQFSWRTNGIYNQDTLFKTGYFEFEDIDKVIALFLEDFPKAKDCEFDW